MKYLKDESIPDPQTRQWLDLLVDDELADAEFKQLCQQLDRRPQWWRSCAMAFIDEQSIRKAVMGAGEPHVSALEKIPPKEVSWSWNLVAVAGVFLAIGLVANTLIESTPESATSALQQSRTAIDFRGGAVLADPVPAQRRVSFGSARGPNMIVEVENTSEKAVYYVDHQVPRFLLEALVSAGHAVNVDQETILVEGPDGEPVEIPINAIVVQKYALNRL